MSRSVPHQEAPFPRHAYKPNAPHSYPYCSVCNQTKSHAIHSLDPSPEASAKADQAAVVLDELIKSLQQKSAMYSAPGARALLLKAVAAVEALRERVARDGKEINRLIAANEHWHLRVSQLKTDAEVAETRHDLYQAAEVHATELAGALEAAHDTLDALCMAGHIHLVSAALPKGFGMDTFRSAVAAMPEEALARAVADEEIIKKARLLMAVPTGRTFRGDGLQRRNLCNAIKARDALDPPAKGDGT